MTWLVRVSIVVLVFFTPACGTRPNTDPQVLSVCEISKNYGAYRDQTVAVRGVDYNGLRQTCPGSCATGPWPSDLNLIGSGNDSWASLVEVERNVERAAKKGNGFEIWVTVVGRLETMAKLSPLGPCDAVGSRYFGYGRLGAFPAQIVVKYLRDIRVVENSASKYDYRKMFQGAL